MAGQLVAFPQRGAFRVHREPTTLVRRSQPRHRYDDPENEYSVWYFGSTLRGALIEVLDHWRIHPDMERTLAAVGGVEDLDILGDTGGDRAGVVPSRFLGDLRVAKGFLEPNPGKAFVSVMDEQLLADLTLEPRVRDALAAGGVEAFGDPPTVNFGTIQGASRAARRVSQAVSRAIFEDDRAPRGIRYISRHTENEECWAVFDHENRTPRLEVRGRDALLPTNVHHRRAVQEAAGLLRLELPDIWAD